MCAATADRTKCIECTACTDGISADARRAFDCPPRDYERGIFRDKTCQRCRICSHPYYAYGNSSENFCITDHSYTQCEIQYYDGAGGINYNQGGQNDVSLVKKSSMPWKSGFQRKRPLHLMQPGSPSSGKRGNLPSYLKCSDPPLGYAYIPDSAAALVQALSALESWSYDCDMTFAMQCSPGYYATLSSTTMAASQFGLRGLVSCRQCPPNTRSNVGGGFLESCPCSDGYTSKRNLFDKFGGEQKVFIFQTQADSSEAQCVDCFEGVAWIHSNRDLYREALVCTYAAGSGISRAEWCYDRTYVASRTSTTCTLCPVDAVNGYTQIPDQGRTSCRLCPAGTHIQRNILDQSLRQDAWTCEPCDAAKGEFQDLPGQHQCKSKKTRCNAGQMLEKNDTVNTRDHLCVDCRASCPEGKITVRSPNKDSDNTCDGNGVSFFGCYDGTADDSSPSFRPGTRLSYAASASSLEATVETCDPNLLPPDSDWVSYGTQSLGVQCYFACLHGVDPTKASTFNIDVAEYVRLNRKDLVPFLVASGSQTSFSSLRTVESEDLMEPSATWTKPRSWTASRPHSGLVYNTFLLVEGFQQSRMGNTLHGMCKSPAEAYPSSSCPSGFTRPPSFLETAVSSRGEDVQRGLLKCAWHARTHLFPIALGTTSRFSVACVDRPSSAVTCKETCAVDNFGTSVLSTFRAGCTVNCLDSAYESVTGKLLACHIVNRDYSILWYLHRFLSSRFWADKPLEVPYAFTLTSPQPCSFTCRSEGSVRMSLSDFIQSGSSQRCFSASDRYSACVPCQKEILDVVCSLFSPPRFYVEGSCNNPEALTELTLDKVCMPCDSSKPHSSLILSSEMAYTGWWGHRSRIAMFNAMDSGGNVPWNDRVTCRYGCDEGFTSNNLGVEQYLETPCVACQPDVYPHDCQQLISRQIAAYLPNTHLCGASSNNYAPYLPSCSTCASAFSGVVQDYVFFPQQQLPSSALECLALCASDRYHSLRTSVGGIKPQNFTSYFAKEPIPFQDLTCVPCSENLGRPCNQTCSQGYYLFSDTECRPCSTQACPSSHYRETCVPGFARDSQCVPCPQEPLYNDVESAVELSVQSALLQRDIRSTTGIQVKKRLLDDVSQARIFSVRGNMCPVECRNNHVWIDVSTGQNPFVHDSSLKLTLTPNLVCIPCSSAYVMQGLASVTIALETSEPVSSKGEVLYSVWNDTNITWSLASTVSNTALHFMMRRQIRGACYVCPDATSRDVNEDSVRMCELKRGATNQNSGSNNEAGVATVTTAPITIIKNNTRLPALFCFDGDDCFSFNRRRRLLAVPSSPSSQLAENAMIKRVLRVKKHPIIDYRDFFSCCDVLQDDLPEYQRCRREMVAALEKKKTLSSLDWGTDYCQVFAPKASRRLLQENSSVVQNIFSAAAPQEPQLVFVDNPDVCYTGTYKETRGDGPCMVCPSGTSTVYPYTGVASRASCSCLPGFFAVREPQNNTIMYCSPCGLNRFRPPHSQNDSVCFDCPENTYTPVLSSAYCYCKPGYFRSDSSQACEPCQQNASALLQNESAVSFYCFNDKKFPCPANSFAPPLSQKRADCTCNPKTHYGSLELPDSQCLLRPPGLDCSAQPGKGAAGCSCKSGWILNPFKKCVTPCEKGKYAVLASSDDSFVSCQSCPIGKYSENPQIFSAESCARCPSNTFTLREGSTSIEECICPSSSKLNHSSGLACDSCPPGTYLNISSVSLASNKCEDCPKGTSSEAGSIGIQSCLCPPGHRGVASGFFSRQITCEPCPVGFFSSKMGSVCIQCPEGYTTQDPGSTSLRNCALKIEPVSTWFSFLGA